MNLATTTLTFLPDWLTLYIHLYGAQFNHFFSLLLLFSPFISVYRFVFWWTKCVMCLWWWLVGWLVVVVVVAVGFFLLSFWILLGKKFSLPVDFVLWKPIETNSFSGYASLIKRQKKNGIHTKTNSITVIFTGIAVLLSFIIINLLDIWFVLLFSVFFSFSLNMLFIYCI